MKTKALSLFLVLTIGLLPFPTNQTSAQVSIGKSIDEAASLKYISDAILLDVGELDDSPDAIGMLPPTQKRQEDVNIYPLVARFIHAKIMMPLTS